MATEFTMPKLGLTMEQATIVEWLVADGSAVDVGTATLRIETDKVETEVEAPTDGVLHQVAQAGEVFRCGEVIGYVLQPGEAVPSPVAVAQTPTSGPGSGPASVSGYVSAGPNAALASVGAPVADKSRTLVSPNARRVAAEKGIDVRRVSGTGIGGRVVSEDVEEFVRSGVPAVPAAVLGYESVNQQAVASVAARNLADLLGVDMRAVPPDPVERRITRDAVALYVRQRLAGPVEQPALAPSAPIPHTQSKLLPASQVPTRTIRLAGMRGTIAQRMKASLNEMAQLTLTMDANMHAVIADRAGRSNQNPRPGYTDYVVAAVARALVLHPQMNSQITTEGVALLPDVHVGLAVALPNGLLVPVIRSANRLTLSQLAAESARLADGARGGTLAVSDYEGGTFSVSTLGMFGVDAFTPVINPPNAGILGVGRLRDDVVLIDGAVAVAKRMTLSLTWDHRVLDGAPAAEFCKSIVDLLADPHKLDAVG